VRSVLTGAGRSEAAPGLIELAAGALEASFVPAEGMLAVSLRHRGEELLGRLGIPFLHPWANRVTTPDLPADVPRDENGLGIHGVLPRPWRVIRRGATRVQAELEFPEHPAFPFAHKVKQRIALEPGRLTIITLVTPTTWKPVPLSFGFHPYLRLPGVPREEWVVALPQRHRVVADARLIPTGLTVPEVAQVKRLGRRTFDDGYVRLGPRPRFAVGGGGRRVSVEFGDGYPVAQVYAPADDDVICFEPMTAPTNALVSGDGLRTVAPGATFRAAFAIAVDG
jgi:aldose 1-epimerase